MNQKQSVGDLALRGLYAASRLGASLEGISRHRFSGDGTTDTYRLAITLEARVTDGAWLSVALGKDFSTATAGSGFSVANLTRGFGDRKVDPGK